MAQAKRSRVRRAAHWSGASDEELLAYRICDLGLELSGSAIEPRLERLTAEFERRGLRFRPYAWLSTDWFSPDGCTGFAIPFYLADQRLVRLERRQMLQVEGSSRDECLRIMRHEAAHALDNAYRLRRRKRFRETFGAASTPYRSTYTPDPTSRKHVQNLDHWYAQSHPLEDWAETFAVWLAPSSRWRSRYAGWPALSKLEYVDELMDELRDQAPAVRSRTKEESVRSVTQTLGDYYRSKRGVYADEANPAFDGQLTRVFPSAREGAGGPKASAFLRLRKRELVRRVSAATGQHRYLLDHVVAEMIERSRRQDLRLAGDDDTALVDAAVVLTSLSTQFLFGAHPRYQR